MFDGAVVAGSVWLRLRLRLRLRQRRACAQSDAFAPGHGAPTSVKVATRRCASLASLVEPRTATNLKRHQATSEGRSHNLQPLNPLELAEAANHAPQVTQLESDEVGRDTPFDITPVKMHAGRVNAPSGEMGESCQCGTPQGGPLHPAVLDGRGRHRIAGFDIVKHDLLHHDDAVRLEADHFLTDKPRNEILNALETRVHPVPRCTPRCRVRLNSRQSQIGRLSALPSSPQKCHRHVAVGVSRIDQQGDQAPPTQCDTKHCVGDRSPAS